ncbi:MAG: PHP domain-containing protein [Pseudomonadota bacterium]|nr:PHP domain-containing protein [Pseudomonadota bacterium]
MHHTPNASVDFHLHSTASDGELTPARVVALAAAAGVRQLALTDHDTMAGLAEARLASEAAGLELVDGVEISSLWASQDIHVVGLGVRSRDARLLERLASQAERRRQRAAAIGARLQKLGLEDPLQQAAELALRGLPARPHFAQVLVAQGRCRDRKQAFQQYLAQGKPAYVRTAWPELETAVRWIREAGGVAVLAHPGRYRLTRQKLRRLVQGFSAAGGQALEVSVSTHSPDMVKQLADLTVEFALYASQGSDYHGPSMRWVQVGRMPRLPSVCRPVTDLLAGRSRG